MPYSSNIPRFSPATLKINLGNLRHNLEFFRSKLLPGTRIMAMVKADAYGCGAVEVARLLHSLGVRDFGVAYTREGVELRQNGIESSIMVMNPLPHEFSELVHHRLEPEIASKLMLGKWMEYIRQENLIKYPIHLEMDTGMHRLGFDMPDVFQLKSLISGSPDLYIKSVFSHLSSSRLPGHDDFTRLQFKRMESAYNVVKIVISQTPLMHILNSAGVLRFPAYQYDMVRLGIGLYGAGLESFPEQKKLKPVQSLYSSISQVKHITSFETIGYERKGKLPSDGRIGILNMGYADGLPRLAGNGRFSVRIGDHLCPTIGEVCMDMTMIDMRSCMETEPGIPVEIYGADHPVLHLAEAAQTIPYEILTGNHQRLHKIYIDEPSSEETSAPFHKLL